ncbi:MAG: SIMPL domain-containing protein [Rikenellaceae bacterium]
MKKLLFTLLLPAFCCVVIEGYAQRDDDKSDKVKMGQYNPFSENFTTIQNFIEVTGSSEITLTPDIFNILITLDEEDSKGRITISKQQDELIRELAAIGVDVEKQLKLSNINSQFAKRNQAFSAISYSLKLTSTEALIASFEIFDRLYISKVYLESYESSKLREAKIEARAAAIKDAQKAADQMAQSLNQKIGNCFQINDMSNDNSATNYTTRTALFSSAAPTSNRQAVSDATLLDAKDIKVNYRVRAKFILYY